ncbi:MAG: cell division protein FtsL [Betaproteobacteria bacterium HGW-Betaproteobacteria-1]|jgi:cell division protein FtsL|nr:MAG: cell division protein FtsL [Betaproteobacteria bacterium HGW-Betaproteobacteria-1]
MTRLNLILFGVLMMTSLGVVSAQHQARKLYFELQQAQDAAKQYEIEWGQLQLEQSTWAMHSRIESIASKHLNMEVPDSKRIQVVPLQRQVNVLPAEERAQ